MTENQPCGHPLNARYNNRCLICSASDADLSSVDELKRLYQNAITENGELRYLLEWANKWIGVSPSIGEQKAEVTPLCNAIDRRLNLYKLSIKPSRKTLADDLPGNY